MKRKLTKEDLSAEWLLQPAELKLLASKKGKTQPGFAILLKYFQHMGRFPSSAKEIPISAAKFMAKQLDATLADLKAYPESECRHLVSDR